MPPSLRRRPPSPTRRAPEAAWTYNANDQKLSLVDARDYKTEMVYDPFGRQRFWYFPMPGATGAANANDFEEYRYDAQGNRTSFRKRDGSILTYQYDALNRMTAKIVPERAGLTAAQTRDVHYDYDLRGLQTKARFGSIAGEGVTNAYDGFGGLASSRSNLGGSARRSEISTNSTATGSGSSIPTRAFVPASMTGSIDRPG